MPTKKNRGTEGRNEHIPTLRETMGLSTGQPIHTYNEKDYLFRNILKSGNKPPKGRVTGNWSDGYDVNTVVTVPSGHSVKRTGHHGRNKHAAADLAYSGGHHGGHGDIYGRGPSGARHRKRKD